MDATYTDWVLVSLSPLPLSWQIGLIVAVVVAAGVVIRSYRHSKRRWPMLILRVLGALLVIGFLTEPALQTRIVRKIRNRLAIVVDQSTSMTLPGHDQHSREAAVQSFLKESREDLAALSDAHILEFYNLDGPTTSTALQKPSIGNNSDLLQALQNVQDASAGQPLAGVVLITDGADLAELKREDPNKLSASVLKELQTLEVPINTISAADVAHFKDISINRITSDEFAFVHNTMEVEVELVATGLGQLNVPVSLKRDNDIVSTQEVILTPNQATTVLFKTKPDKIGKFIYTVSIPPVSGEAVSQNNKSSFAVKVIRDKIRVLQVTGRPSWDERFLRQHLKENPNVDLISFFILRTPTDQAAVPEKEMSLIPFPVNKIFNTELHTFDIIILQNFDYRPYPMQRFLPNIRKAVENGLGLVMIGGDQSFADGGYQGTAIDAVLPVALDQGGVLETTEALSLTTAGQSHPITQLLRSPELNAEQWLQLPRWTSINRTGGTLPNATALVVSPSLQDSMGKPLPLISVREVNKGRSLAIASDSMWRWRFNGIRDGGTAERAYHRFWSNALRWLVRDPAHSRVQVLPSKQRYDLGAHADVAFRVLGHDYQPLPAAALRVTLERNGGTSVQVDDLLTDQNGAARLRYSDLSAGAYRVVAEPLDASLALGEDQGVFIVAAQSPELAHGSPRPRLLQTISAATEGHAAHLRADFWEDLKVVDPEVIEVDKRRNTELWDNGWALLLGITLFALDWGLRRRSGYL